MRKLLLPIALLFITAACAQTSPQSSGMMKEGMQCPMMKDGKSCSCCEGMMKSSPAKTEKPKTADDADHKAHHPQQ